MAKIVKRTVRDEVTEWVCEIYVIRDKFSFLKYLKYCIYTLLFISSNFWEPWNKRLLSFIT